MTSVSNHIQVNILTMSHSQGYEDGKDYSVSKEEMKRNRIPIAWRDECAGLLIPLNNCRRENWYLPWKCSEERHAFEKCEYIEYKKRVEALKQEKAQEKKG